MAPNEISNLKLWLVADRVNMTVRGTDEIQLWNDISGNSRQFESSAQANEPFVIDSVINGKSVARFDGSSEFLRDNGAASYYDFYHGATSSSQKCTAALLFYITDLDPEKNQQLLGTHAGNSANSGSAFPHLTAGADDDKMQYTVFRFVSGTNVVQYKTPNNSCLTQLWNWVMCDLDTTITTDCSHIFINNVEQAKSDRNNPPHTGGPTATLHIGVLSTQSTYTKMDLREVVMYDKVLSQAERDGLARYYNDEYGLTISI
ncbi:MAG: LamG-like jellyroll fold domain-containing protein [bacterium]